MPRERSIDDFTIDELSDEIAVLAGHINAAMYRWLRLLSAFDRKAGWRAYGTRSMAHWLSWRCGIDLHTARQKIRVARALDHLPAICGAFGRGELSFSKVRALTRIATPANEEELLMLARYGTAQHIEKVVRGYRRSLPVSLADANEVHARRHVEWHYEEDGSLVVKMRLTAEEGSLFVAAVESRISELNGANRSIVGCVAGADERRTDRADAVVDMARHQLETPRLDGRRSDHHVVYVHADIDALRDLEGINHLEEGCGLATETTRRLLCDGSLVGVVRDAKGNVLDMGRKKRTVPTTLRRALQIRDAGCVYPGCTNRHFVDAHHVQHWIHGGGTRLDNLASLCPFHHRLLHEGGFAMRTEPDGRFSFTRHDGQVVRTAGVVVEPDGVECQNEDLGLDVTPSTTIAKYIDQRWDRRWAVEWTLRKNHPELFEDGSAEPLDPEPVTEGGRVAAEAVP